MRQPWIPALVIALALSVGTFLFGTLVGRTSARQMAPLSCSWSDSTLVVVDSLLKAHERRRRR